MLENGIRRRFVYPEAFVASGSKPDYIAHNGQSVVVVRPLTEAEAESPSPDNDIMQMYRVRADDGWQGDAWEDELEVGE